jgi:hypothetical protein
MININSVKTCRIITLCFELLLATGKQLEKIG